jgi:hypothetical protein
MPNFAAWDKPALEQFAATSYLQLCVQDAAIQQLRLDLKDAARVNRDLLIKQGNHHDDWK